MRNEDSVQGKTLAGGVGVLGYFGILFWNLMISLLGAFASGFVVAGISLVYYSRQKKQP